jgi:hypothetical protein
MDRRYVRGFNGVAKEESWNPLAERIRSSNRVAWQVNERSGKTLGFEIRAERDLMLVLTSTD